MLRIIWILIGFLAALFAQQARSGESMRQFQSETVVPLAQIIGDLEPRLPPSVVLLPTERGAILSYSGQATPAPLAAFLTAAFDGLAPETLAAGRTLSLALTMQAYPDGTDLSLMVLADFPDTAMPVPEGSIVMLDGTVPGACEGQIVLRHPERPKTTAKAYRAHLEAAGFAFPEAEPDEASFFIGYAPACTIALYLKPDRGTTLIVVRYLEE